MDSTVEIESGRRLDVVGEKSLAEGDVGLSKVEKRLAEGNVGLSKESSLAKRIKGWGLIGNVKKAAETVLVLAAMGKMRGGRGTTEVENNLMADALCRLAKVCEGIAPKGIFPQDAFGDGFMMNQKGYFVTFPVNYGLTIVTIPSSACSILSCHLFKFCSGDEEYSVHSRKFVCGDSSRKISATSGFLKLTFFFNFPLSFLHNEVLFNCPFPLFSISIGVSTGKLVLELGTKSSCSPSNDGWNLLEDCLDTCKSPPPVLLLKPGEDKIQSSNVTTLQIFFKSCC